MRIDYVLNQGLTRPATEPGIAFTRNILDSLKQFIANQFFNCFLGNSETRADECFLALPTFDLSLAKIRKRAMECFETKLKTVPAIRGKNSEPVSNELFQFCIVETVQIRKNFSCDFFGQNFRARNHKTAAISPETRDGNSSALAFDPELENQSAAANGSRAGCSGLSFSNSAGAFQFADPLRN
jgi:hypothetical protein